jgi:hypothetical protein
LKSVSDRVCGGAGGGGSYTVETPTDWL